MALLAAPRKGAFCIDSRDAEMLNTRSGAVLEALQKIRKAEASGSNTTRLRQLDERISTYNNAKYTKVVASICGGTGEVITAYPSRNETGGTKGEARYRAKDCD